MKPLSAGRAFAAEAAAQPAVQDTLHSMPKQGAADLQARPPVLITLVLTQYLGAVHGSTERLRITSGGRYRN